MLVATDRRTGMVFALPVERKGAADPHAVEQLTAWVDMLGSSQMARRSVREPAVMQVAAAVRDARSVKRIPPDTAIHEQIAT